MPMRAAASAHCFLRCSVGATTVICCTTWWCSSHEARVSAKVVFPAPGVATARKSRGCSWMYFSMAPCCQARSFPAVPQGARPGKAGERLWEAVVVTVSGSGHSGTWGAVRTGRKQPVRDTTTGPPYRRGEPGPPWAAPPRSIMRQLSHVGDDQFPQPLGDDLHLVRLPGRHRDDQP